MTMLVDFLNNKIDIVYKYLVELVHKEKTSGSPSAAAGFEKR